MKWLYRFVMLALGACIVATLLSHVGVIGHLIADYEDSYRQEEIQKTHVWEYDTAVANQK